MNIDFIDLSNYKTAKLVEGVLLYPLKVNKDASGVLVETLRRDWKEIYGSERKFAMQYYSITPPGLARDEDLWHKHEKQEDRFLVAKGEIIVAVASDGILNLFRMKANENPYILLIPKTALHGFMVTFSGEAILLNFPTQLYNPQDELRVPHKEAGVRFPNGELFAWERIREEFKVNEY